MSNWKGSSNQAERGQVEREQGRAERRRVGNGLGSAQCRPEVQWIREKSKVFQFCVNEVFPADERKKPSLRILAVKGKQNGFWGFFRLLLFQSDPFEFACPECLFLHEGGERFVGQGTVSDFPGKHVGHLEARDCFPERHDSNPTLCPVLGLGVKGAGHRAR